MGTRSIIGRLNLDGTIDAHYCHWDGYFEHNGRILHEHYQDIGKVEQLVALGDMSVLAEEIGERHDFDWDMNEYRGLEKAFNALPAVERAKFKNQYEYEAHLRDIDPRSKMCTFYMRDRGEKDCETQRYRSIAHLVNSGRLEEYLYLYDMKRRAWLATATPWKCSLEDLRWSRLADLAKCNWGADADAPTVQLLVPEAA